MADTETTTATALERLRWPLRLTRAGLVAERVTHAFWPVWSILLAVVGALAFGLPANLPVEVAWVGLLVAAGGLIWALWSGVRRFRWVTREDALARLDATLPGRPITALRDTQATGATDAASQAVWQAHLERMAERVARARAVEPDLRLARRDPYALRYVALLVFVLAVMFGSLWRVPTVGDLALGPNGSALAAGPAWEGWVQPPAYTGKPSLYLNEITRDDLAIPAGSHVTIRLYGPVGSLTVAETVSGRTGVLDSAAAAQQDFDVTRSGKLSISGPKGRSWDISLIPDEPPTIGFVGDMGRSATGELHQDFAAKDDYGVVRGKAVIALDTDALDRRYGLAATPDKHDPITLDLPMPITGNRADFTETLVDDLSKDAWANLPVTITLSVEDAAGHTGTSETHHVILPGRRFFDPLAAAVIEMRRDLLWSMSNAPRTAEVLRAVTWKPEGFIRNQGAYLLLRVTMRRLETGIAEGLTPAVRNEVAEALWQVALQVEDGDLSDALEKLRRAQDRLSEAIRRGASKEEIAGLMQDMNQALQDYVRKLAEQQQQNPDKQTAQNQQQGKAITGDQMQQLMDRLQQLMEQGRMAEAQELLDRLRELTENMRVTQGQGGMPIPGQQAMQGLSDTLRQQQGLSDEAFQDLQKQFSPGGQQDGQQQGAQGQSGDQGDKGPGSKQDGQLGQGGDGTMQGQSLADRQKALREQLKRQTGQALPGDGTDAGKAAREALDRAGRAMDQAEQALRDKDMSGALDRQSEAMEAMRDGLRNLGEAMAKNQQEQNGNATGEASNGTDPKGQRDPLGRQLGNSGSLGNDRNMLQGTDVYRRAREILDEIRRRVGDQNRSAEELDYLKRLLDRF